MNKKGNWTLSAVFGFASLPFVILPLAGLISGWWVLLGIFFIFLAFAAN